MMARGFRVLVRVGVVAAVLAGLAVAWVLASSEWLLRRRHAVPLTSFSSEGAVADSAEGRRMAILVGCLEGCHGLRGEGGEESAPGVFRAVAPAFSQVLPSYSDPELERLVRSGIKRDGVSAVGMPSGTFHPIGDADLARIVAHLRRRPAHPPVERAREIAPLGRLALALGKWKLSADAVDRSIPRWGDRPITTPAERGRYLASIVCSECHGLDLRGDPFMGSPALAIVRGYGHAEFERLMRTGVPIGGRDLGLMGRVARVAFVHFTDDEVRGLHTYLGSLGDSARATPPAP